MIVFIDINNSISDFHKPILGGGAILGYHKIKMNIRYP